MKYLFRFIPQEELESFGPDARLYIARLLLSVSNNNNKTYTDKGAVIDLRLSQLSKIQKDKLAQKLLIISKYVD